MGVRGRSADRCSLAAILALFLWSAFLTYFLSNKLREIQQLHEKLHDCNTGGSTNLERGKDEHPHQNTAEVPAPDGTFAPGTLKMSRVEALSRCYVDPEVYRRHLTSQQCPVSEKFKVLYYQIPKSASSSSREIMEKDLKAEEKHTHVCDAMSNDYLRISFVREPLNRFWASYEEMIARNLNYRENIPEQFRGFISDLPSYQAYDKLFPQPHLLVKHCEQFVDEWDGKTVFDNHLHLQAPLLMKPDGTPRNISYLGNVPKVQESWDEMHKLYNTPQLKAIRGRSYPRRMDIKLVSKAHTNRICQLAAIDYCCLNFRLPPECDTSGVMCKWDEKKRIVPAQPIPPPVRH